jgi:hypothetical protein
MGVVAPTARSRQGNASGRPIRRGQLLYDQFPKVPPPNRTGDIRGRRDGNLNRVAGAAGSQKGGSAEGMAGATPLQEKGGSSTDEGLLD